MIFKNLIKLFLFTCLAFCNISCADQPAPTFQLSPEELEALKNNPFGPLSDDEINEFVKFMNQLSPQELEDLEKLGESIIKEMEAEAKKEETIPEVTPEEVVKPEISTPKIPKPLFEEKNKIEAQKIIRAIIKYLREIRQESIKDESVSRRLKIWEKDLNDLTYFLHAMDKPEMLEHLASKDFSKLYSDLKKFKESLEENISSFMVKEVISEEESEDPYEILGVPQNATQNEIEDAFKKLQQKRDPKILEEKLKNEGLSEKDISRQLKEAKLSFSLIETAYESLKNPKIRAQIDNELKTKQSPYKQVKEISKAAFNKILVSFSTAFYEDAILNQIQKLFEKYEPQALEKKKELEQAEAQAKKSQEELAKRRVIPSPSTTPTYRPSYTPREKDYERELGRRFPLGEYDFGKPTEFGPTFPERKQAEKPKELQTTQKAPEQPKKEEGDKEKGGKEKGKIPQAGEKEKGKKEDKEKKDEILDLIKDLDSNLKDLENDIDNPSSNYNQVVNLTAYVPNIADYAEKAKQIKDSKLNISIEKTDKILKGLEKVKNKKDLEKYKKEFSKIIDRKGKANIIKKIGDQLPKFQARLTVTPEIPWAKNHPVGIFINEFTKLYDNLQKIVKFLKDENDAAKDVTDLSDILKNVTDVTFIQNNQDQIKKLTREIKDFINKAEPDQKDFVAAAWQDQILSLPNLQTVRAIEDASIRQLKNDIAEITQKLGLTLPELQEPEAVTP